MRGVFLDSGSVVHNNDVSMQPLQNVLSDWHWFEATPREETKQRIVDADIVVSNKVLLDRDVLQHAKHLQLICVAATGTNNIDLDYARERNIPVCNVRDYATPSVVEHTFNLILALSRQLFPYRDAVQSGGWSRSTHFAMLDFPIAELSGKSLGIIGYGVLGRAVARVGEAFGMRILIAQSPRSGEKQGRLLLNELLAQSDVVTLHCPLTPETQALIGRDQFAQMKSTAVLINTARGGIVDELALLEALQTGKIRGAAVDVLEKEPPAGQQALITSALPNLIVTPHIAWASVESRQRLINEISHNIAAFLRGEIRNRV